MHPQDQIRMAVTGQGFGAIAMQGHGGLSQRDPLANSVATKMEESPLSLHMGELLNALEALSKQVDDLERTLQPVLVPGCSGQPVGNQDKAPHTNSDLITGLIIRKEQVALISLKLSSLTSRIQL